MAVTFEIRYRILCNFIGFVVVLCSIFGQISFSSVPVTDSAATSPNGAFDWANLDNFLQHFDRPCSCVYMAHLFYSGRRPEYRTGLALAVVLPVQWSLLYCYCVPGTSS